MAVRVRLPFARPLASVRRWRFCAAGLLLAVRLAAADGATPELCVAGVSLNDHFVQPESTRRMVKLVNEIYQGDDPLNNPFRNAEQVTLLRKKEQELVASGRSDPAALFDVRRDIALHLLQSGQLEEAAQAHIDLERFLRDHNQPLDGPLALAALTGKALTYLRLGETTNCVLNHNGDSCLFPIQGGGVHVQREGSEKAVAALTELLTRFPNDLRGRWLLNIAYMTLGEYPDKVPPRWLIDPKHFKSDYDLPRFPDVAGSVGLAIDGLAGGVVMEDFDHDGLLDLMVSAWGFNAGKDQTRVFRNNGDGTFEDRTEKAGLAGLVSGLNMIHGDYNNDGFADVLILRGGWLGIAGNHPVSLLRNNRDFTFTDVTEEAGLLPHRWPTQTAAWFDYNGDGLLDLFIGNESLGRATKACELYRNNGDGTFTECAAEVGLDIVGFIKGVAAGDYDNDGRPDLYLSGRHGVKMLMRNEGPAGGDGSPRAPWRFTNVAEAAGVTAQQHSFPTWFWDYDNDGWLDLMVTGYSIQDAGDIAADYLGRPHPGSRARLFRNQGDGTFADVSRAMGVNRLLHTMGCNFGDLDNDGWLDFYAGTGDPDFATLIPSRMFRNDGGKKFQDVTTAGGFGQLQKGHGIAFGDLDNDGDQDIYSVVGGAVETDNYMNQLFANPGNGNRWIKLYLRGVQTNRLAIGARVKIVLSENGQERAIHRQVGTGASFGSSTVRQEIGLGQAERVERVEVFWPVTRETQVFTGLEPGHVYELVEGERQARAVTLPTFQLPTESVAGGHHHAHRHASPPEPAHSHQHGH